ncbi:hypothetical protein [Bradyrhizobium sp. UFLA05-112]
MKLRRFVAVKSGKALHREAAFARRETRLKHSPRIIIALTRTAAPLFARNCAARRRASQEFEARFEEVILEVTLT